MAWHAPPLGGVGTMKVAIVTGAARGIGASTVGQLAAAGWAVLAVDIASDIDGLPYAMATPEELAAVVASAGEHVRPFIADVRDIEAMAGAVAQAEAHWGGLDAAIGCAGALAGASRCGRYLRQRNAWCWTSILAARSPWRELPSRRCCGALSHGPAVSSRSRRLRPPAVCRCSVPTARRRQEWSDWCAPLAPSSAAPV